MTTSEDRLDRVEPLLLQMAEPSVRRDQAIDRLTETTGSHEQALQNLMQLENNKGSKINENRRSSGRGWKNYSSAK